MTDSLSTERGTGRPTTRVGLKLTQDAPIEAFRAIWAIADAAPFDHCWAFDHLAAAGPGGPRRPVFEGWSLLSAMAALTARPRVGLLVTGMTYRNPALLAKAAVTVDHLSGGRLEFGIGAAWAVDEHRMFGIDGLEHRIGRFSEGLTAIKRLWTQDTADLAGRYYTLDGAVAEPKPVQRPHPPIWIGGSGPSTLKLVARHADVWNAVAAGREPAELTRIVELSERLDAACAAIDRDPAAIRRSVQLSFDGSDPAALEAEIARYAAFGFSEIIVTLAGAEPERTAATLAEHVLPAVRS